MVPFAAPTTEKLICAIPLPSTSVSYTHLDVYKRQIRDGGYDDVVIDTYGNGAIDLLNGTLYLSFKPFWRAAGRAIDDRGCMNSPATFFHRQRDFWERERIADDDRH